MVSLKTSRRELLGAGAAAALVAPVARAIPPGQPRFLWGAATAAHQIEGGNFNSDFWVSEHLPGTYMKELSGDACDSWNRWREDLALIRLAGLNCYRFSVEWARIEPERGEFSIAALDYYRRICQTARDMGIEPIVTFHHFTSPRWIAGQNGWENPQTADDYARYCERAARALAGSFGWACTINEPNAQVNSKVLEKPWAGEAAFRAAGAKRIGSDSYHTFFIGDSFKVRDVCIAAHTKGAAAIKGAAPGVRVGMTLALQDLVAGPGGEVLYRRLFDEARAPFYAAAQGDDFIGVQTYTRFLTGPTGLLPLPARDGVLDMFALPTPPDALAATIREAHAHARVPVLVTENGFATTDDAQRIRFLSAALDSMGSAIADVPVLGYIHWSLLDNFEWSSGYVPRMGLVAVDRATFRRTPKPSLLAYRQLIADARVAHTWA